jgi:hypothetical protein
MKIALVVTSALLLAGAAHAEAPGRRAFLYPGPLPVLSFTTQPDSTGLQVYQRSAQAGGLLNLGQAAIPLGLMVSGGTARTVECMAVDSTSGAAVTGWNSAATQVSGSVTFTHTVPARKGWNRVQCRANGDSRTIVKSNAFGVGRLMAVWGQSEAEGMITSLDTSGATITGTGVTVGSFGTINACITDGSKAWTNKCIGWGYPSNSSAVYTSTGAAQLLNYCVADAGVNCAVVGFANPGQYLGTFVPGQANYTSLAANLASVGGAWEVMGGWIGASDSLNKTSTSTFESQLSQAYLTASTGLKALNSWAGPQLYVNSHLQPLVNTLFGNYQDVLGIRTAYQAWDASNGATYVTQADTNINSPSGPEMTLNGYLYAAANWARAFRANLSGGVTDAGPTLGTTGTLSGTVITIPITQANGTDLVCTGNWWQRFGVFDHGQPATAGYPPTGGTCSASQITLTLPAVPGGPVDVYFMIVPSGQTTNNTIMVYDNNSGDDGISWGRPLTENSTAILVGNTTSAQLAMDIVQGAHAGTPIAVTGSYYGTGYTPTAVDYQVNCTGAWTAATGVATVNGHWEATTGSIAAAATGQTLCVRDHTTNTISVASLPFAVNAAGGTVVTFGGGLSYDTSTPKFGTAAANGGSTYDTTMLGLVANTFPGTIEAWVKASSAGTVTQAIIGGTEIWLGMNNAGKLTCEVGNSAGAPAITPTVIDDGNWHHVFATWWAGTLYCGADGAVTFSETVSGFSVTPGKSNAAFAIRQFGTTGGTAVFGGEIDEVATWAIPKYIGAYTVPTAPYTGSESGLIMVCHLDSTSVCVQ